MSTATANAFVMAEAPDAPAGLATQAGWQAATISVERADAARLMQLDAEWQDLAARADEPNVFMDPGFIAPGSDTCVALLAWNGEHKLVGVWALAIASHPVLPVKLLRSPARPHSYLGTPVLDRAVAHATVGAMLDFIAANPSLPKFISFDPMRADGTTMQALAVALADRNSSPRILARGSRPVLESNLDGKQYFEKAMSGSSRKKLRQHRRRLEEKGPLESRVCIAPADVLPALEDFLALEAAGWKGAAGTALLCDPAEAAFVRAMVGALAKHGNAQVHGLYQNGKAIACQVVLRAGKTAFTWKTAYDETLRDFSPGMLLLEDYTAAFLADATIERVDSCSLDESGFMSAWSERQEIAHVLIDARPGASLSFIAVGGLYQAFLRTREKLKDLYLRGRRSWKRR